MEVRRGGAWRTITTGEAFVNGAWRTLRYGEAYIDGAWRQIVSFIQPLTLSLDSPTVRSTSPSMSTPCGASPSGGLSPFTYLWTLTGSSGVTGASISGSTSATVTVSATVVPGEPGDTGTVSLHCVVTDSLGSTASGDTTATFRVTQTGTGTL